MMQWTLGSCLLILVMLAIRQLFRKRLDPVLIYALWLTVALRLLIPGTAFQTGAAWLPSVTLPERSDIQSADFADYEQAQQFARMEHAAVTAYQGADEHMRYSVQTVTPADLQWEDIIRYIWIAGSMAVGLVLTGSNLLYTRRLCRSRRRVDTAGTLPVYVTELASVPCLYLFPRPAIYVTPEIPDDSRQMGYILLHEQAHWRHRDPLWSLLRCLCLAVHWWNPLVWWAVRACREDMELACDAAVIRTMVDPERLAYGRALIDMSLPRPSRAERLACTTAMYGSGRTLKTRVRMIAQKPRMKGGSAAVVLAVTVLALAVGFTGCTDSMSAANTANTEIAINGTTVRFALPKDLTAEAGDTYNDQILSWYFAPMAYGVVNDLSNTPITWIASGGVEEWNSACLTWEDDTIQTVALWMNHTWVEDDLGAIDGTQVPAYLLRVGHDLYTASGQEALIGRGYDLSEMDLASEYWTIFFAHPEDETMLVFSLCTRDFTMEEAAALARSVQY